MDGEKLKRIQFLEKQQLYDEAMTVIGKLLEQLLHENLEMQNVQIKNANKQTLQSLVAQTQTTIPNINPSFSIHCNTVQRFRNLSAHHNIGKEVTSNDLDSALSALISIFKMSPFAVLTQHLDSILQEMERRRVHSKYDVSFFNDVHHIYANLEQDVRTESSKGDTIIYNIGLDLQTAWPQYKRKYLSNPEYTNIHFKVLLIDPESQKLKEFTGRYINLNECLAVENSIIQYIERNKDDLMSRNISFELKRNHSIPLIHGFQINRSFLYWSFCQIENHQIDGGLDFYHYSRIKESNTIGNHYLQVYESWFQKWWEEGTTVVLLHQDTFQIR